MFHTIDTDKDSLVSPDEVIQGSFEKHQQRLIDLFTDGDSEEEDEENESLENEGEEDENNENKPSDEENDSFEAGVKHDDL